MAEIIPFKGVLYNPKRVKGSDVTAPPYDIVTPELKDILYQKSPYNIIRLDFGKDMPGDNEKRNRYTRARRLLREWLKTGILIEDKRPAFYCYETVYKINKEEKKLRGFFCAVKIEDLGKGSIYPHEMTRSKPKADRLNILRRCRANLSPIFSLYSSKDRVASSILESAAKGRALISSKNGDDFVHRLYKINDKASVEAIKKELADKHIFIADGHHRYETAIEFRNEMNKKGQGLRVKEQETKPWDYVLMFLANMEDEGLTLFPTHRIVGIKKDINIEKSLKSYFDIMPVKYDRMFSALKKSRHSFGMYLKCSKAFYLLKFKGSCAEIEPHSTLKKLDVTILHKIILEKLLDANKVEYEMSPDVVVNRVESGLYQVAFFLNPTSIEDVKKVALAGERMPPKSTYFYPKLLTGMVIYKF